MYRMTVLKLECIRFFSCYGAGRNLISVILLLIYCVYQRLAVKNLDTDGTEHVVCLFWKDVRYTKTWLFCTMFLRIAGSTSLNLFDFFVNSQEHKIDISGNH